MGTDDALIIQRLRASTLLLLLAAISCHPASEPSQHSSNREVVRLERATGWFHGPCFAISDPNVARGTAVELVVMGEPQSVLEGQVGEKVSTPASCAPLLGARRSQNAKSGTSFYGLEGAKLSTTDMGIGMVAPPQKLAVVNGLAQADLNSD